MLHKRSSESLISILIQNHIKKVPLMLREGVRVRQRGFTFYANDAEILKRVSSPLRLPFTFPLRGLRTCKTASFPIWIRCCSRNYLNNVIKQFTNWGFFHLFSADRHKFTMRVTSFSRVVPTVFFSFSFYYFLSPAKLKDQVLNYYCVAAVGGQIKTYKLRDYKGEKVSREQLWDVRNSWTELSWR